jgi:hypothetical protein
MRFQNALREYRSARDDNSQVLLCRNCAARELSVGVDVCLGCIDCKIVSLITWIGRSNLFGEETFSYC